MMYTEEYISIGQAAWLLNTNTKSVKSYITEKKLYGPKGERRNQTLIDIHSVENIFYKKVRRFDSAVEYFNTENKVEFWDDVPVKMNAKSDLEGYLSIPQMAFLIGASRQGVHYILSHHSEIRTITRKVVKIEKTLISEQSLREYVDMQLEQIYDTYHNLIEYLDTEDKEVYWSSRAEDIRKRSEELEAQRKLSYKKNYVRKNRKQWENLMDN